MKIETVTKHGALTFDQVPKGAVFICVDETSRDKEGRRFFYMKLTDSTKAVDLNYGKLYTREEFESERISLVRAKLVTN